jgi:hypothetical protein
MRAVALAKALIGILMGRTIILETLGVRPIARCGVVAVQDRVCNGVELAVISLSNPYRTIELQYDRLDI